jgi:hypothetical protein
MSSSGASGAPPHVLEWTIKDKNCISSGCHQSRQPKARSIEASSNFENEINSQHIYFLASQSIRLFCRKATNQ